jgi:integrase
MGDDKPTIIATPELVLEWKRNYIKEGHSIASTTTYYIYIKKYVDYGIEINQKTINIFRDKYPAPAGVAALKCFFKFLVEKKEFNYSILTLYFGKSKTKKKFPESLNPIEVDKVIVGFESMQERYFTLIMASLGLRISECLKLTWDNFSWLMWLQDKSKMGEVNLTNTKGGKFRVIPIDTQLMQLLYDVSPNKTTTGIPIGGVSNLVFNFGIESYNDKNKSPAENLNDYINYAADRYREILYKVTKDTIGKRCHPHMFRHYRAQYLMDKGLPIESLKSYLGHASISSTEIYAQASSEKLKKDLQKIGEGNANN